VQLVGVGGIGKTAIAGRLIARLRAEGWRIAVHEGRWNPTALFATVAAAIGDCPEQSALTSDMADPAKFATVGRLLASQRLVVVDDFEQNLLPGGDAFADPSLDACSPPAKLRKLARLVGVDLARPRPPRPGRRRGPAAASARSWDG
jgi:hypothetical protein